MRKKSITSQALIKINALAWVAMMIASPLLKDGLNDTNARLLLLLQIACWYLVHSSIAQNSRDKKQK